jgi:sodium-dependent dicarboxylate transporter 2/3/5
MMFPIGMAVISTLHGPDAHTKRSTPFATALLLGIAYGASIGGIATPVGTAPNQIFFGQMHALFPGDATPHIGFGEWTVAWMPISIVFAFGAWWILTRVALRVEDSGAIASNVIREQRATLGPMQRGEKMMSAMFVVTALLWVTREDVDFGSVHLHGWSGWIASLQSHGVDGKKVSDFARYVTDATVAVGMAVLCFVLPVDRKRGVYLLDWETANKVPWDVLLLFGGGFCLAKGFQASGLDRWFGDVLAPLLRDRPAWQVVGIVVAVMTLATEFTSNVAITTLTLPVLAQTAVASGFDPLLLMAPATIAASSGFALPVSTPPNTIVFGSRRVPMGSMLRAGLVLDLFGIVLLTTGFHFWVRHVWHVSDALPAWAVPH